MEMIFIFNIPIFSSDERKILTLRPAIELRPVRTADSQPDGDHHGPRSS